MQKVGDVFPTILVGNTYHQLTTAAVIVLLDDISLCVCFDVHRVLIIVGAPMANKLCSLLQYNNLYAFQNPEQCLHETQKCCFIAFVIQSSDIIIPNIYYQFIRETRKAINKIRGRKMCEQLADVLHKQSKEHQRRQNSNGI